MLKFFAGLVLGVLISSAGKAILRVDGLAWGIIVGAMGTFTVVLLFIRN